MLDFTKDRQIGFYMRMTERERERGKESALYLGAEKRVTVETCGL